MRTKLQQPMLMAKKDSISYQLAYFTIWAVWKDFTLDQKIRWMFVAISMQVLSSLHRYENKAAIAYAYGEERQHIV